MRNFVKWELSMKFYDKYNELSFVYIIQSKDIS